MTPIDVLHAFAVASRSGRAVAILGEADLEAEGDADVAPGQVVQRLAAIAHPRSDWRRHMMLRHGLESALVVCDRVPGNEVFAAVRLEDGRKAVVLRHLAGDDAVERLLAAGIDMKEGEEWTTGAGGPHASRR